MNFKKDFDPENMRNRPQKLLIIGPQSFTGPAAQEQKSLTTKSPLMQDWVFWLGIEEKDTIKLSRQTMIIFFLPNDYFSNILLLPPEYFKSQGKDHSRQYCRTQTMHAKRVIL